MIWYVVENIVCIQDEAVKLKWRGKNVNPHRYLKRHKKSFMHIGFICIQAISQYRVYHFSVVNAVSKHVCYVRQPAVDADVFSVPYRGFAAPRTCAADCNHLRNTECGPVIYRAGVPEIYNAWNMNIEICPNVHYLSRQYLTVDGAAVAMYDVSWNAAVKGSSYL